MHTHRRKSFLSLLLVVALAGACGAPPPQGAPPSLPVKIEAVQSGVIDDSSDYVATMQSRQSVSLQPQVSGQVQQILVKAGDRVESGTLLLVIDPSRQEAVTNSSLANIESARSALEESQADLANAEDQLKSLQAKRQSNLSTIANNKTNFDRDKQLLKEGAITRRVFDDTATQLKTAQADLDGTEADIRGQQANIRKAKASIGRSQNQLQSSEADAKQQKIQLTYYSLKAPFAGSVGDIPVKVGDFVSNSTKLLNLTQNEQLELQVAVPIEQASRLKNDLTVQLVDRDNKPVATGKVFFVAPNVDVATQSILVKAAFSNTENKLRADQFVKARLIWDSRPGVLVPTAAISRVAGQNFIFVAQSAPDDKKTDRVAKDGSKPPSLIAKQQPIKLGKIIGNSQEVTEGLKSSDKIITSSILILRDGMPVVPATEKAEAK